MAITNHAAAANFQRWEMPEVGTPSPPKVVEAPAQPTVHELAELEQQARDEGYAAGHAEGLVAAAVTLHERMAQLDALYAAAARPLLALDVQTEQELAELAMVVARRVIASELQLSPTLILKAVRQAAAAMPAATRELRVHLHPDDVALLREMGGDESHWQLIAEPSLARGDCQLESARSRLDARVESRLAAVIDAVLGEDAQAAETIA